MRHVWERREVYRGFGGKPEGSEISIDLGLDGRMLNGCYGGGVRGHGMDLSGSAYIKWRAFMNTVTNFRFS
jgi:hypothetical protein